MSSLLGTSITGDFCQENLLFPHSIGPRRIMARPCVLKQSIQYIQRSKKSKPMIESDGCTYATKGIHHDEKANNIILL